MSSGFILFVTSFKYLGSIIDFIPDNIANIQNRIKLENKIISTLNFILYLKETSIEKKNTSVLSNFYESYPIECRNMVRESR